MHYSAAFCGEGDWVAPDLRLCLAPQQPNASLGLDSSHGSVPAHDARRLLWYLRSCLGSWSRAEAAFETTLLQLARKTARAGHAPPHVFEVAHRVQLRLTRGSAQHAVAAPARGAVEGTSKFERLSRAAERFDELAPDVRRAVCLREWDGMSFDEIAATLELTSAEVERLFFAAR